MMDPEFVTTLESELQRRGVAFDLAALQEFVADTRPLTADDPDVQKGADCRIVSGAIGRPSR